ncbi:MAG: NmrA family NAD(P)-binding protein [Pseudonocardiaceae bacterium]
MHSPLETKVRREVDVTRVDAIPESVIVADFDDSESVTASVRGISRAYLVTPSSETAEAQQTRFAEIAAKAGVEQLVKLSQFAADEASPVRFLRWHASVERRIRELGVGFTFLRPNLYFQGLLAFSRSIATEGRFFAPIGDARVSAVDVRDIAAVGCGCADRTRAPGPDVHHHRPGSDHPPRDCRRGQRSRRT